MSCPAHNLQYLHLFVTKDIFGNEQFKVLNDIIGKLKEVFRILNYKQQELKIYSDLAKQINFIQCNEDATNIDTINDLDYLYAINDEDDITFTALKNSNVTRWNSTLAMVRSFTKNAVAINIVLGYASKIQYTIQSEQLANLKALQQFLEIFETGTTVLQGQSYSTLALNILFLNKKKTVYFFKILFLYALFNSVVSFSLTEQETKAEFDNYSNIPFCIGKS